MSDTRTHFKDWLQDNHLGKGQAVKARNMKQWGTAREIRHLVHDLRMEGVPICSGGEGYYYANTGREVRQTLAFLISIQDDLSKVINGLRVARDEMHQEEYSS